MSAPSSLHMHRGYPPPEDPRQATCKAHATVEPILDAFQLRYTHTRSAGNVSYQILGPRELTEDVTNLRLVIPVASPETFSLDTARPDDLTHTAWAAGVESALACRREGLIRNFCDPLHWDRFTDDATPDAVRKGLKTLGLQPGQSTPATPRTDPLAKAAAQRLLSQLGPDHLVILFGSRQRGDNADHSDVDLLIQITERSDRRYHHALDTVAQISAGHLLLVDEDSPYFDVLIVDQWGNQVWKKATDRLNPDGGSVTVFAHPETLMPEPYEMPLEFPGQTAPCTDGVLAYLLTGSAMAIAAGDHLVEIDRLDQPLRKR
ncbi:MAG: nucleotidyltransferase domain-containing protein [Rhodospirillaceae bacterium]|nr:nucleotidyltransferase domain-containing protein [Rhodospirillaceae bacterium]